MVKPINDLQLYEVILRADSMLEQTMLYFSYLLREPALN